MRVRMMVVVGLSIVALLLPTTTDAATARKFKNCTALHKVYPHGVAKSGARDHVSSGKPVTNFKVSTALYNANKGLDRDKDGVACEAH
jgi:hypothetical protein